MKRISLCDKVYVQAKNLIIFLCDRIKCIELIAGNLKQQKHAIDACEICFAI